MKDFFLEKIKSLLSNNHLEEAISLCEDYILKNKNNSEIYHILGIILLKKERLKESIYYLKIAASLDGANPKIFNNLGMAYFSYRIYDKALHELSCAIRINNSYYEAYNNRGVILKALGQYEEALENYNISISQNPNYSDAYFNKAIILDLLSRSQEAIKAYIKTISITPNHYKAYNNLGTIYEKLRNYKDALKNYEKAIEIEPRFPEPYNNIGTIYKKLERYPESIDNYNKAIILNSGYFEAYSNRAIVLRKLQKFDEALEDYNSAIKLKSDFTEALVGKSEILLKLGNLSEGWRYYNYRFFQPSFHERYNKKKLFLKKEKVNKLIIWGEQGIGDQIYFLSYLINFSKFAKEVVLELDPRIIPLFQRYLKKIKINNVFLKSINEKPVEIFDFHLPLGSVPGFVKENNYISTKNKYYFLSNGILIKKFFPKNNYKNIGISWKTLNKDEEYRNISLDLLSPILDLEGINFFNLQFGNFNDLVEEYNNKKKKNNIISIKEIDNTNNLEDLSNLIFNLDAVVTIQNTTVHLSGALGKKTFLLTSKDSRWMWGVSDKISKHYPAVEIFRQKEFNDWNEQIAQVAQKLKKI